VNEVAGGGHRPPVVLVDARNVLRSTWPNIPEEELVELLGRWVSGLDVRAEAVFDGTAPCIDAGPDVVFVSSGRESADDWIAGRADELAGDGDAFWLVTSDRGLRTRAGGAAERTVGGGSFARTLLGLRR
jgi:hypothetical protein